MGLGLRSCSWFCCKASVYPGQTFVAPLGIASCQLACGSDLGQLRAPYLEGQGNLVSRLITLISHVVTLVILILIPVTKST